MNLAKSTSTHLAASPTAGTRTAPFYPLLTLVCTLAADNSPIWPARNRFFGFQSRVSTRYEPTEPAFRPTPPGRSTPFLLSAFVITPATRRLR